MIDSLSKKLNLRVNDYTVILNEKLNEAELRQHDIKKAGFFENLMIKPSSDEVVFWAKNCNLKYLNDDFENAISPILDANAGANIMFGTTAYLWFKENILLKFTFQIIQNELAAKINLENFEKKLIKFIGSPIPSDNIFKIWETENQKLILEFPHNIQHGYIHLMFNE